MLDFLAAGFLPVSDQSSFSSSILALPDDVLAVVTRSLRPIDVFNLSLSCHSLKFLTVSDKVWLAQCERLGLISPRDLVEWRKAVSSYKSLCRFLVSVEPLIGIWVHQNPELGNVVYVMWGFVSVVGCRIIPQELGPMGLDESPLLWAPVFEIVGDHDGSMSFFLHGRERDGEYFYPGTLKSIDKCCNVLFLEVEPKKQQEQEQQQQQQSSSSSDGNKLLHSKSFVGYQNPDREFSRKICRSESTLSRSHRKSALNGLTGAIPFSRLAFGDRRKLLEFVANRVRLRLPDLASDAIFPRSMEGDLVTGESFRKDMIMLSERRSLLIEMYRMGGRQVDSRAVSNETQMDLSRIDRVNDHSRAWNLPINGDESRPHNSRRRTVAAYVRVGLEQIFRRSKSANGRKNGSSSSGENKHAQLHEFLKVGDTIGLSLHASTVKLSTYRAWPNMHDNRFALYKLPLRVPAAGQEYAGLWGGTFGWPPGRVSEDKPGKALFFLLLSYEESEGQQLLIATKILEGTHYVLHPNGSAMFVVKVDQPSSDSFPWDTDGDCLCVEVKHAYIGEGIANGYGFRYPGSKPGSLFVIQNGLLAFVWKESRAVLTLQKLDLQELLKKGERVPALPPIANFTYLTKSYSNVFAGFSGATTSLPSQRQYH